MAELVKIPVRPGGMNADVVENELGVNEFVEVTNLRQVKAGLWESVKGYLDLADLTSPSMNIKAAGEFTEELTGERFILFQDDTILKRLDYDEGDGNGYENEMPSTLSLPAGVTIGASAVLRFFYFRGVIRITGASEPLWYGYISRTLMADAVELIDLDDFEADADGWVGSDATLTTPAGGYHGTKELQVSQTGVSGSAKKSFSIVNGTDYIFRGFAASTGDGFLLLGSADNGSEYANYNLDPAAPRVEIEFTAVGTTLYAKFIPEIGSAVDIGTMDFIKLEKITPLVHAGWELQKAELASQDIDDCRVIHVLNGDTVREITLQNFVVYDESQYALLGNLDSDWSINGAGNYLSVLIPVPASLLTGNKRISGIGVVASVLDTVAGSVQQKHVGTIINFAEAFEAITFWHADLYYDAGNTHHISLRGLTPADRIWYLNNGWMMPGNRIKFENDSGIVEGEILTVDQTDDSDATNPGVHAWRISLDAFTGDLDSGPGELASTKITIYRRFLKGFDYTVFGVSLNWANSFYCVWAAIDLLSAVDFYEFSGIPAGTTSLAPNYSHHIVTNERALVLSSDEQDIVRYSPLLQFDSFPNGNIIQTQVGDKDQNLALVRVENKFVILKNKSLSQGQYSGNAYYEDIGIAENGLYAENGYAVINGVLFFMDKDDVYAFSGLRPEPLLKTEKMRQFYLAHLDSSSFILYNKLDNEIWFVLADAIMIFHPERGEWYLRETDITPVGGFLDDERRLVAFDASKFVVYNHALTTFDEEINWEFVTRIEDLGTPEYFKKLGEVLLMAQCSGNVAITMEDTIDGGQSKVATVTPSTTDVGKSATYPKLMFRELKVTVAGAAAAANMAAKVRSCDLVVSRWR